MAIALSTRPDITTGDPVNLFFDVKINNQEIATGTEIKCAIVTRDRKLKLCPTETPFYVTATLTPGSPTRGKWTVSFTGEQTAQLLTTPADLTSDLKAQLMGKFADTNQDLVTNQVTGFGTALLEIEVGAPYEKTTIHNLITVGKGLIG